MAILWVCFLRNNKTIEDMLEVLKVGHITTCADNCIIADRVETLNAFETCKGTVRSWDRYATQ
jgi:hypothetical protein